MSQLKEPLIKPRENEIIARQDKDPKLPISYETD